MIDRLKQFEDKKYKEFISKLIPNISKDKIIGIRVDNLRKLAKEMIKNKEDLIFLENVDHYYLEENQLHLILIDQLKDVNMQLEYLDKFINKIDNWSVSDIYSGKKLRKNLDLSFSYLLKWLENPNIFSKRIAIKIFMSNFEFKKEYLDLIASIKTDEYYLQMMIAWYFTIALIKNENETIKYIFEEKLDKDIHNLVIKKSIESLKISKKLKEELKKRRR